MSKFKNNLNVVLDYLKKNKKITTYQASNLFKATRLSELIYILQSQGHNISCKIVKKGNISYALYVYND